MITAACSNVYTRNLAAKPLAVSQPCGSNNSITPDSNLQFGRVSQQKKNSLGIFLLFAMVVGGAIGAKDMWDKERMLSDARRIGEQSRIGNILEWGRLTAVEQQNCKAGEDYVAGFQGDPEYQDIARELSVKAAAQTTFCPTELPNWTAEEQARKSRYS